MAQYALSTALGCSSHSEVYKFAEDAKFFEKSQLYALKLNSSSPEALKNNAYRLLDNVKRYNIDLQTSEKLLYEKPELADEIKQAHRQNRHRIGLQDFMIEYLKEKLGQYFK